MRTLLITTASIAVCTILAAASGAQPSPPSGGAVVVLDNARVRVFKTTGLSLAGVEHKGGVVVALEDGPNRKTGDAWWATDPTGSAGRSGMNMGPLIIVEPKDAAAGAKAGAAVGS